MFQIHLVGKGLTSRGVRCKVLSMQDVEAADKAAGALCTPESLQSEFQALSERFGMEMMVQEVTEKPCAEADLPTAKWKKVSAEHLNEHWKKYFGLKDTIALKSIYRKEHSLTQKEVDEIMGKKVELADED